MAQCQACSELLGSPWQKVLGLGVEWVLGSSGSGFQHCSGVRGRDEAPGPSSLALTVKSWS